MIAETFRMLSTILVVDEDQRVAETLAQVIERFDNEYACFAVFGAQQAFQFTHGVHPDLVVTAAIMHGNQNLDHALTLRDSRGCKVLLMSAYPQTADLLRELEAAGKESFQIFPKPCHPHIVKAKIRNLLANEQ